MNRFLVLFSQDYSEWRTDRTRGWRMTVCDLTGWVTNILLLELLFVTKNSITDTHKKKYLSTNAIHYCERQSGGMVGRFLHQRRWECLCLMHTFLWAGHCTQLLQCQAPEIESISFIQNIVYPPSPTQKNKFLNSNGGLAKERLIYCGN